MVQPYYIFMTKGLSCVSNMFFLSEFLRLSGFEASRCLLFRIHTCQDSDCVSDYVYGFVCKIYTKSLVCAVFIDAFFICAYFQNCSKYLVYAVYPLFDRVNLSYVRKLIMLCIIDFICMFFGLCGIFTHQARTRCIEFLKFNFKVLLLL